MKKLTTLGSIRAETRTNLYGNKPNSGVPTWVLGQCVRPQTFDPALGSDVWVLLTTGCDH